MTTNTPITTGLYPPPLPTTSAVHPDVGVVIVDLPCRQCGYNVRGLAPAGACPECGTRVALSLREDLLRFCDPRWVGTLHRGVRFILWATLLIVLGVVAALGLEISGRTWLSDFVFHATMVAGAAIGFAGSWWLTEPDPSGLGEDRYGTARKVIRVTLLLGVIETVLDLAVYVGGALPPWVRVTTQAVALALQIAALVGLLATLQYLRRLSLRIPDPAIAKRSHFLTYALGISYGIIVLAISAATIVEGLGGGQAQSTPAFLALGCVLAPVGLALIVFAIMHLFMMIKFGRRLGEQAAIADLAWREPLAPPPSGAPTSSA